MIQIEVDWEKWKKENDSMNAWLERKLPWGVNNFLRWFTTLLFWPIISLTMTVALLICPFRRCFYNGAEMADWAWFHWWKMVREDILDKED